MRSSTARFRALSYANVVTIGSLLALAGQAAEFAPYRARIATPSAAVRSGPGERFYATDTLAGGDTVDIYRQQANGWCAIRPPEGSFSWVFGRHVGRIENLEMSDGDGATNSSTVAEIDKPDVASRIGSRMSSQRNAVQVRLKKGEVVRILGEEELDGEAWYKVAPPSGEFRWIHISHLRRVGPIPAGEPELPRTELDALESPVKTAVADDATEKNTVEPAQATTSAPIDPSPLSEAPPLLPNVSEAPAATAPAAAMPAPPAPSDTWRVTTEKSTVTPPVAAAPTAATPPAALSTTLPTSAPTTGTAENVTSGSGSAQPIPSPHPVAATPQPPSRTLAELELRLSRMVSEPPVAWNIESLQTDANAMLLGATSDDERVAVQNTLTKLERFAAIARRHRQLAPGSAASAPPSVTPLAGVTLADGTRFDAVGVLRPVASRRPGAPPFALVDDRGQVLSFVTPNPGVDLQPLVGQRIGVTGDRGFIPEFQRVHVVAGRAAPVSERIVR